MAYGTNGKVEKILEVPFETKVVKDPKLKKGQIKVITEGKKGSKKVTYTIEDSKITKEEEQEIEAPQDREIHVGEGVNDGTHEIKEKKEIPFETRIEYDKNLEAGQREETGGTPGEQERTNTLVIKDGKVEETKEGEFKTTKKPVDKVIKIGIKPIVKEVEKPFETEYILSLIHI